MAKPIPMVLFLVIFFLANSLKISCNTILCPQIEKEALISFKQSLKDPSNRLSSWNTSNCCNWKGVVCSNITGNVHQLHLPCDYWFPDSGLQGKINPSLLKLKHLKYLDLSGNSFTGTFPSFMGSLTSLEYLNLSYVGFYGEIPPTLGNLSRLHTLSLEGWWPGGLYVDSIEWLRGLSQLEHLNMNEVNLTNAGNWIEVINTLPSLVELHLSDCSLNLSFHPSSDVNVTSLVVLDLSYNYDLSGNFFNETFPSFMGSLTSLEYLNLSNVGFYGKIPPTLGNLSRLHTLSLEGWWPGGLYVDSIEWLRGLSQLEHLNMNEVNLTNAGNWIEVINTLPSLVELHLASCRLNLRFDPSSDVNITSLAILDLSDNDFSAFQILKWIFRQSNLVFLDLWFNYLGGPIPAISNITKLQYLNLGSNDFNSTSIPDWLYSCKDLEFVSLEDNSLQGRISNAIGNLTSLTTFNLKGNKLSGDLPKEFVNLFKLHSLDLSENILQGNIPDMFGNMSDLGELRLNFNKFTGNLPTSIGQLSNLVYLEVGNNMMRGVITETHFINLTKLSYFYASMNQLTLKLSPDWVPPFKLDALRLGSWNLGEGSRIPSWIETQKSTLTELDLSNTGISGNVPKWFWEISFDLNLAHNNLSGNIPDIIGTMYIYLSSNQFRGPLPRVGISVDEINLSDNLFSGGISHFLCDMGNQTSSVKYLLLGGNKLTGEIPDCWMKWPSLKIVNLSDNHFSGSIPTSIGTLREMVSLNLFDNKLSGQIPVSVSNCTNLVKMDLSNNNLVGNIPDGIGTSLAQMMFLILRSNKMRGTLPRSICHLNSLQILDLSNNAFSGRIPSCVNNLTAMTIKRNFSGYLVLEVDYGDRSFSSSSFFSTKFFSSIFTESASVATKGREANYDSILSLVNNIDLSNNKFSGAIPGELTSLVELISLNLSGNHLTGLIPKSIGDLKQLESLDLSRNALSGEMPSSFTAMSFLNYLNLSCNNLRGRIPESTQLRGMNASSFEGNDLCGPPLTRKCRGDDDDDGEDTGNEEDDKKEIEWFYVLLSLGYALGLSAFCTTLVFKKPRRAYFGLLECMWDKLYVHYHVTCTKLKRRRGVQIS